MWSPDERRTWMGMIICFSKCWPCQFDVHSTEPHTWMDGEDIDHAIANRHKGFVGPRGGKLRKRPPAEKLAAEFPCGCWCNRKEPK
jgi:hypothetical protein